MPRRKSVAISVPLQGMAIDHGILELREPPISLNNLFKNAGKRRVATGEYATWQAAVALELNRQAHWHVPGAVAIRLTFRRDSTQADLDNLAKALLDALVKNGRISDDRNVDHIVLRFTPLGAAVQIDIRRAQ